MPTSIFKQISISAGITLHHEYSLHVQFTPESSILLVSLMFFRNSIIKGGLVELGLKISFKMSPSKEA